MEKTHSINSVQACQNCKRNFEIRKEDLIFYDQVKVPTPLMCPDCRMQRRLMFRNERTLYKRACDLCGKDGVSIYPSETPFPVYCQKCWWGDNWDPTTYKMDYDRTRPFIDQFALLKNKVPRSALLSIDNVNSEYVNNSSENKNCYLIFAGENNEDCMYSRLIQHCKNSVDCAFLYDSELCYECVDTRKSFKCQHSERLQECVDVLFSFDMRNCQNCLFCTNGRNLSYCIENKQYSKEEYEKLKTEILSSYQSISEAKKKYEELRSKALVKYASSTKCNNATGDYMYNCHDGVRIFDVSNAKNCSYVADAEDPIDCHDINNHYFKGERCYNIMGSLQTTNSINGTYIMYGNNVDFSDSCYNCTNCFGSAGLNKKNYHILNKEYSKEEYLKLKEEIVAKMKEEGVYGEFFPASLSPFKYNETTAQEYFPLSKEEALNKGYGWQEQTTGTYGKETIQENEIPQTIEEISESILNEILVCKDCKKNFRITKSELDFYKRLGIPLPHQDFECRHKARMAKRNPRKLWSRTCMCTLSNHQHGTAKCINEFETAYSPDRPEVVYCETCYQQEVS